MSIRFSKGAVAVLVAALAVGAGWFLAGESLAADAPPLAVGTYDPQQIAQDTGLPQKMMQEMQGLQQRMTQARENGDQQAMAQVQAEAQQVQRDMVTEFEGDIEDVMASVAEEAGVQLIAVQITYTGPGVETRDVTQQIVEKMKAEDETGQ